MIEFIVVAVLALMIIAISIAVVLLARRVRLLEDEPRYQRIGEPSMIEFVRDPFAARYFNGGVDPVPASRHVGIQEHS